MVTAFIALGSNLENPLKQVTTAFAEIAHLADTTLEKTSALYQSLAAGGPEDQPDYINAVVQISTELSALDLLDKLQEIEQKHQRKRLIHWGPRTLDLDILLYGNQQIKSPRLTVPHAQMHWRNFVLEPLFSLAPELILPSNLALETLVKNLPKQPNLIPINEPAKIT